jgi:hypothetical protein
MQRPRFVVSFVVKGPNWGKITDERLPNSSAGSRFVSGLRMGQVGQDSHRRPAVMEHAARCPGSSRESNNVQPLCSQFCSQRDLHPSAGRRSSHELGYPDFAWSPHSNQPFYHLDVVSGSMSRTRPPRLMVVNGYRIDPCICADRRTYPAPNPSKAKSTRPSKKMPSTGPILSFSVIQPA